MTSKGTDPRCRMCSALRSTHGAALSGTKLRACPDGSGRFFRHPRKPGRASMSASVAEVETLSEVVNALLRGADMRPITKRRAAELGMLARRAAGMRKSIESNRTGAE